MEKISFIIAEKSFIVRTGLMKIINSFSETLIVKELSDFKPVIKYVNKINPDFLIINHKFLNDAHDDIKKLFLKNIKTKFIIFTGTKRANEHFIYFDQHISIDDDKNTITKKLQSLISEKIPTDNNETGELSEREKDVVRQIALGKTNKEIAEELFISTHTVITHRKNITRKLDIKTVSGLTVFAILNNIIEINEAS